MFQFHGPLAPSKSWYNRALILKSFAKKDLDLENLSFETEVSKSALSSNQTKEEALLKTSSKKHIYADDILYLKKSLEDFLQGKSVLDAGLGGTTLRFLALRVSRNKGTYIIKAGEALLKRPQQDLVSVLDQLGVLCEVHKDHVKIISEGWVINSKPLSVNTNFSTQFLSGLLLSSLYLESELKVEWPKDEVKSKGYLDLTLKLLTDVGVIWTIKNDVLTIPVQSSFDGAHLVPEPDISSAFSLIAAAIINGQVTIEPWSKNSLQPDIIFTQYLQQMKISYLETDKTFSIKKTMSPWSALQADLSGSPDLFPVLSVLCAFAEGESYLYNASQLRLKESDRIAKTVELLNLIGIETKEEADGLKIFGNPNKLKNISLSQEEREFESSHDHRMAMAAGILILAGFPIHLKDPFSVAKSYPDFFTHIGLEEIYGAK